MGYTRFLRTLDVTTEESNQRSTFSPAWVLRLEQSRVVSGALTVHLFILLLGGIKLIEYADVSVEPISRETGVRWGIAVAILATLYERFVVKDKARLQERRDEISKESEAAAKRRRRVVKAERWGSLVVFFWLLATLP